MMTLQKRFEQSKLIPSDSLGICTRVTFKWLALKLAKGEFQYESLNVGKSEKRMAAYGDPFIERLCKKEFSANDPVQSGAYITDDLESIKHHVGTWGNKIVDKNKKEFNGIVANDAAGVVSLSQYVKERGVDWSKFHAIYTFYMRLPASVLETVLGTKERTLLSGARVKVEDNTRTIMAGHAVGISGSDSTFFDANVGEFSFDSSNAGSIVNDIESHVTRHYAPHASFGRGVVVIGM